MVSSNKLSASKKFRQFFGPGVCYRPFDIDDQKKLADRIPKVMLEILKNDGWCSYKDQILWLCDPDDWQPAAQAWCTWAPNAQVVARTGFGDLFIWDGEMFWFCQVHESLCMRTVGNSDWFFSRMLTSHDFAPQTHLPVRIRKAKELAGPLNWNEMYTYVPALALGGSEESSRIERVKAIEALTMLAELAPVLQV